MVKKVLTDEQRRLVNDFVSYMRTKLERDKQEKYGDKILRNNLPKNNRWEVNEQQRKLVDELKERRMMQMATKQADEARGTLQTEMELSEEATPSCELEEERRTSMQLRRELEQYRRELKESYKTSVNLLEQLEDRKQEYKTQEEELASLSTRLKLTEQDLVQLEETKETTEQLRLELKEAYKTSVNLLEQLEDKKQEYKTQEEVIEELKNDVAILIGDERVQEDQLGQLRQELEEAGGTIELIRREKEEIRTNYELIATKVKNLRRNRAHVVKMRDDERATAPVPIAAERVTFPQITDAQRGSYALEVHTQLDTNPSFFKHRYNGIFKSFKSKDEKGNTITTNTRSN